MQLSDIVSASAALAATRSRKVKIATLAELLNRAGERELPAVVAFLTGRPTQGRIGTGWRTLAELGAAAWTGPPALTVPEVDDALGEVATASGSGSAERRSETLHALFRRATEAEQRFLFRLLTGELRQGALEGVMLDAIAAAAEVPAAAVRRAFMLSGRLPVTALAAVAGGERALGEFRLELGRPLRPMLASPAESLDEALHEHSAVLVEYKMDGARIQVHRDHDEVHVYTRTLREITAHVGELVDLVRALPCESVVLDGETLALTDDGRPRPFQETMSRFSSQQRKQGAAAEASAGETEADAIATVGHPRGETGDSDDHDAPEARWRERAGPPPLSSTREEQLRALLLRPYFFDCLHLDGLDLLDLPLRERNAALRRVAGKHLIPGEAEPGDARSVLEAALASGHEGVMVKDLDSAYAAGRRGRAWLKVKPVHTLDLVVLAAEWGHGRRAGFLSNLHLGARDPRGGPPIMVGKTFKGLTDELLAWQTRTFPEIETSRDEWTVHLRPELVVEIELDGAQVSTRYPGGVALRFARVLRYRPDKDPADADTIDAVRATLRG